jgi:hypothetical protein
MVQVSPSIAGFQKLTWRMQVTRMEMVYLEIGSEVSLVKLVGPRVPAQEALVATGRLVGMSKFTASSNSLQ